MRKSPSSFALTLMSSTSKTPSENRLKNLGMPFSEDLPSHAQSGRFAVNHLRHWDERVFVACLSHGGAEASDRRSPSSEPMSEVWLVDSHDVHHKSFWRHRRLRMSLAAAAGAGFTPSAPSSACSMTMRFKPAGRTSLVQIAEAGSSTPYPGFFVATSRRFPSVAEDAVDWNQNLCPSSGRPSAPAFCGLSPGPRRPGPPSRCDARSRCRHILDERPSIDVESRWPPDVHGRVIVVRVVFGGGIVQA